MWRPYFGGLGRESLSADPAAMHFCDVGVVPFSTYTLRMLGKFSWVIIGSVKKNIILGNYYPIGQFFGWLKKIIILGNYYPVEPSNNLTNIGQLFLLNYWANIHPIVNIRSLIRVRSREKRSILHISYKYLSVRKNVIVISFIGN